MRDNAREESRVTTRVNALNYNLICALILASVHGTFKIEAREVNHWVKCSHIALLDRGAGAVEDQFPSQSLLVFLEGMVSQ